MSAAEAYKSADMPVDQQRFGKLVNDLVPNMGTAMYEILDPIAPKGVRPFDIVKAYMGRVTGPEIFIMHGLDLLRRSPVNLELVRFEEVTLMLPASLVEEGDYDYRGPNDHVSRIFSNAAYVRQLTAMISSFQNCGQLKPTTERALAG